MNEPQEFLDAICRSALPVSMADEDVKVLLDDLTIDGADEGRLVLLLQRLWYLAASSATAIRFGARASAPPTAAPTETP